MKFEDLKIKNLADRFYYWVQHSPERMALEMDGSPKITYRELEKRVQITRAHLRKNGYTPGTRALLLFPLSIELMVMLNAMVAEGVVPIFLDPRLPLRHWQKSLKETKIKGIFSVQKVMQMRFLLWSFWQYELWSLDSSGFGVKNFRHFFSDENVLSDIRILPETYANQPEDICLISLTSGSTGQPKRIDRDFMTVKAQQDYCVRYLPPLKEDRHLPMYGTSIYVSIAQGAETFVPKNIKDTEELCQDIERHRITRLSGPPGTIARIAEHLQKQGKQSRSVQNILIGGAPIPRWLASLLKKQFPQAQVYLVYGCTECEPISASLDMDYLNSPLPGYNVGPLIPELELIQLDAFDYHGKKIFEVGLRGANVSVKPGEIHRTGDLAYLDENKNIWLVGRKKEMIHGVPLGWLESQLEQMPGIRRAAIVKKGQISCYIEADSSLSEIEADHPAHNLFREHNLSPVQFVLMSKIPVDPRHEWKIERFRL